MFEWWNGTFNAVSSPFSSGLGANVQTTTSFATNVVWALGGT